MLVCILLFLGIFAFFYGITASIILGPLSIVTEPMVVMVAGFILACILLFGIHSFGVDNTPINVQANASHITSRLGFIAAIATCVLQLYVRFDYNEWGFFTVSSRMLSDVFTIEGIKSTGCILILVCMALAFFVGLFPFIPTFFSGDFSEYVTITETHCSDGFVYESGRSDSYVSVGQFIFTGTLWSVPAILCSTTPLIFFITAAYAVIVCYKSKKRLLIQSIFMGSIALVLTILTFLPNFGVAYVSDYKAIYELNKSGTYEVIGLKNGGPCRSGELIIESEINGIKVSSIQKNAFQGENDIQSVYIPEGVTVESGAFDDCNNITSVALSSTNILGFENCPDLTTVRFHSTTSFDKYYVQESFPYAKNFYLPKTTTSIIAGFGSIYYDGTLSDWASIQKHSMQSFNLYLKNDGDYAAVENLSLNNMEISDSIFSHIKNLRNVVLGEGIYSIGDYAFDGCSNLTKVTMGNDVTSIGSSAFYWCSNLTNIQLSNSLTSIESLAFYECHNLTTVTIPKSLTYIGSGAFFDCLKMNSITFEGTTEEWNAIEKEEDWDRACYINEVICSNGTITL